MVSVKLSPEGRSSFKRLPDEAKLGFDSIILRLVVSKTLRLPGRYPTHQLEGGRQLWTMKVGRFRGVYRWDGEEIRFIRFGDVATVYWNLPK
jgi:hypothetical protein